MTEVDLKATILKVLRQTAPEADLTRLNGDENLRQALDIDSYDFLMFLIGLDEAINVEIPEADYGQIVSLNDVVSYVERYIAKTH